MTDPPNDKLAPLRLLVARHAIGLVESREIPPICDQLLNDGVYSPSLAELATTPEPRMWDLEPLLRRTIKELNIAPVTTHEAFILLANHLAEQLSKNDAPLSALAACEVLVRSCYFRSQYPARQSHCDDGRPFDFVWHCYGAFVDVTDFDAERAPKGLTSEQGRWESIRSRVQQSAHRWFEGGSFSLWNAMQYE